MRKKKTEESAQSSKIFYSPVQYSILYSPYTVYSLIKKLWLIIILKNRDEEGKKEWKKGRKAATEYEL